MRFDPISELIRRSYSSEAAIEFLAFEPSTHELKTLIDTGVEVLTNVPYRAGACAMMNAMYAARMQMYLKAPVYVAAGSLYLDDTRIFGDDSDLADVFNKSNNSWDGHCWLVFGRYLVDVSLFRTAYTKGSKARLAEYVKSEFGEGRGLLVIDPENPPKQLRYDAGYVLTYNQVTALVNGFPAFFCT